jgi:hypothetical protein
MPDDKAKSQAKDAAPPSKKKGDAEKKPATAPTKPLTPLEGAGAHSRGPPASPLGRDRFAFEHRPAVDAAAFNRHPAAAVLYRNIALLDKYVDSRDDRYLARALRYANHVRRHLPTAQLRAAAETYVLDAGRRAGVLELLADATARRPEPVRCLGRCERPHPSVQRTIR